jgi:hypothetical protein
MQKDSGGRGGGDRGGGGGGGGPAAMVFAEPSDGRFTKRKRELRR